MSERLRELARLFLKLGVIGFGGPAAHIAMMEAEVTERRDWLTRDHFLDLVGATNLIPGPNSTEMAMHVGFTRGGWPGLLVAGASFILPAALMTGTLAWVYARWGTLPALAPVLAGIKPAVLAIIFGALWRLGRAAVKNRSLLVLGVLVAAASLAGVDELLALLAGGLAGAAWLLLAERGSPSSGLSALVPVALPAFATLRDRAWGVLHAIATGSAWVGLQALDFSLVRLFWFFLRVGAVLYGSGYVLVAFLEGGLVQDYGWLTQQQLLDAIAIGQFTPGPVLTTATFIGYFLGGLPGAAAATLAIFLPSFFFVAALNPIVPRLREMRWPAAFLDAVNVSAVGLMAAVTLRLAAASLTTPVTWVIAAGAVLLHLRWKVNTAWIVTGGALLGWLLG